MEVEVGKKGKFCIGYSYYERTRKKEGGRRKEEEEVNGIN